MPRIPYYACDDVKDCGPGERAGDSQIGAGLNRAMKVCADLLIIDKK